MSPGLCATCRHVRRLESSRASVFYMCLRADTDPVFPRYPRLPVLTCAGYEQGSSSSGGSSSGPRMPSPAEPT